MRSWASLEGYFDFADLYDEELERVEDGAVLVELGVWHGRSLVYLAQRAKALGRRARVVAVDTFATPPVEEFRATLETCEVADIVEVVQSDSAAAAALFQPRSVDFVFIDADHSYEGVRRDIAAWRSRLKPGATMAGHDRPREGVHRAVAEAFGAYQAHGPCSWIVREAGR
jgi:predicted O-methyltransferase YrrM